MKQVIILMCAVLFFSSCQRTDRSIVEGVNNNLIKQIDERVTDAERKINAKMDSLGKVIERQQKIVSSFKPVYEKINNAGSDNDAQLRITAELLARHRATPLARD